SRRWKTVSALSVIEDRSVIKHRFRFGDGFGIEDRCLLRPRVAEVGLLRFRSTKGGLSARSKSCRDWPLRQWRSFVHPIGTRWSTIVSLPLLLILSWGP